MKKLLQISIFIILALEINAQDIHFSMFYKAPIFLNPANTGNFEGKWRIMTNYRNQGNLNTDFYSTGIVSFDIPFYYFKKIGGIGITFLNDRTSNNTLQTNQLIVSNSYFVQMSSKSVLQLGLSLGLGNKFLSNNGQTFPNQFDNTIGLFNSTLNNHENFETYNKWFLDLSWGVVWSYNNKSLKCNVGLSMFHFNKPNLDFTTTNFALMPKYQIHWFLEKTINKVFFIRPKFIYSNQNKATEMLLGSEFGIILGDEFFKNIYIGGFMRGGFARNQDAMIINLGFYYKHIKVNFSYDYNIVQSEMYNHDQTFEVALLYIFPKLEVEKRTINCEIF